MTYEVVAPRILSYTAALGCIALALYVLWHHHNG